jgi:hypothetical protein
LLEALWLIDAKLRNRSSQDEERNNVILGWLGLLTAKNEEGQTTSEQRKNEYLYMQREFQVAHQFTVQSAAAPFARGQAPFHQSTTFKEIEHVCRYFRDSGARCA